MPRRASAPKKSRSSTSKRAKSKRSKRQENVVVEPIERAAEEAVGFENDDTELVGVPLAAAVPVAVENEDAELTSEALEEKPAPEEVDEPIDNTVLQGAKAQEAVVDVPVPEGDDEEPLENKFYHGVQDMEVDSLEKALRATSLDPNDEVEFRTEDTDNEKLVLENKLLKARLAQLEQDSESRLDSDGEEEKSPEKKEEQFEEEQLEEEQLEEEEPEYDELTVEEGPYKGRRFWKRRSDGALTWIPPPPRQDLPQGIPPPETQSLPQGSPPGSPAPQEVQEGGDQVFELLSKIAVKQNEDEYKERRDRKSLTLHTGDRGKFYLVVMRHKRYWGWKTQSGTDYMRCIVEYKEFEDLRREIVTDMACSVQDEKLLDLLISKFRPGTRLVTTAVVRETKDIKGITRPDFSLKAEGPGWNALLDDLQEELAKRGKKRSATFDKTDDRPSKRRGGSGGQPAFSF